MKTIEHITALCEDIQVTIDEDGEVGVIITDCSEDSVSIYLQPERARELAWAIHRAAATIGWTE